MKEDFRGIPMVKTLSSAVSEHRFESWSWSGKIPHAKWHREKKMKEKKQKKLSN